MTNPKNVLKVYDFCGWSLRLRLVESENCAQGPSKRPLHRAMVGCFLNIMGCLAPASTYYSGDSNIGALMNRVLGYGIL